MTQCRYQWTRRQGLAEKGLEPCGECGPCTNYGIEPVEAGAVAAQVREALAADDRKTADRLLRRAVHVGVEPADLFLAGGPSSSSRKSRSKPAQTPAGDDGGS